MYKIANLCGFVRSIFTNIASFIRYLSFCETNIDLNLSVHCLYTCVYNAINILKFR